MYKKLLIVIDFYEFLWWKFLWLKILKIFSKIRTSISPIYKFFSNSNFPILPKTNNNPLKIHFYFYFIG